MAVRLNYEELEGWMRKGRIADVRKLLKSVPTTKIPRIHAVRFCNLCRRVGLFSVSIRVMNPIVRPTKEMNRPATPEELAEYAVALTKVGATREALQILEKIPLETFQLARLYEAFALFPEWRYSEAVPKIREFLNSTFSDPYLRTVAQVNLASALIFTGQLQEADDLLTEIQTRAIQSGYALLMGNSMELSAQVALLKKDFLRAHELLSKSLQTLGDSPTADNLFARKWSAVANLYENGATTDSIRALQATREEATRRSHWETTRDCDFHLAWFLKDREIFNRLFHGTPFTAYRDRMKSQMPDMGEPAANYLWTPRGKAASGPSSVAPYIQLKTGDGPEINSALNTGHLMHKLLICLCSDFYRPARLGALFSHLFPDEYFNPTSSPNRIHQLVRRLRGWFRSEGIPLQIQEVDGAYTLSASGDYGILVESRQEQPTGEALLPTFQYKLIPFIERLVAGPFTAKQLAEELQVSLSTATRILRDSLEAGIAEKVGGGPRTQYRLLAKRAG